MNTFKRSQFEAALARMSFGSVPIDGIYWLDPKGTAASDSPAGALATCFAVARKTAAALVGRRPKAQTQKREEIHE